VKDRISACISDETISKIVSTDLGFHIRDKASAGFQDYYFRTVSDKRYFLSSDNFFRAFKKQYALQGIDNSRLDGLEKKKQRIIELIDNNQLADLYFEYFAKAPIRYKNKIVRRDLGSFFTKLVHTFKPGDFCPLDNPIRNYFGLNKESFYIAFLATSRAYKEWAGENARLLHRIRRELKQVDKTAKLSDRMTDLKLLDLIFWYEANHG
jgi:hypothetical protein